MSDRKSYASGVSDGTFFMLGCAGLHELVHHPGIEHSFDLPIPVWLEWSLMLLLVGFFGTRLFLAMRRDWKRLRAERKKT